MLSGFPKTDALSPSTPDSPDNVSESVSPMLDEFGDDFDTNFIGKNLQNIYEI